MATGSERELLSSQPSLSTCRHRITLAARDATGAPAKGLTVWLADSETVPLRSVVEAQHREIVITRYSLGQSEHCCELSCGFAVGRSVCHRLCFGTGDRIGAGAWRLPGNIQVIDLRAEREPSKIEAVIEPRRNDERSRDENGCHGPLTRFASSGSVTIGYVGLHGCCGTLANSCRLRSRCRTPRAAQLRIELVHQRHRHWSGCGRSVP